MWQCKDYRTPSPWMRTLFAADTWAAIATRQLLMFEVWGWGSQQIIFKVPLYLGFLTKLFSGFSRNTKLAKMLPCFAKLSRTSRVSQNQIFAIFVFRESYNFRESHEIRLKKHNGTCHGLKKISRIENNQRYYNFQYIESLLFYEIFYYCCYWC